MRERRREMFLVEHEVKEKGRFRLIQNGLGYYGVLDTYTQQPVKLISSAERKWDKDRSIAQRRLDFLEEMYQLTVKNNTWREIE
jgi:hypothetical protein